MKQNVYIDMETQKLLMKLKAQGYSVASVLRLAVTEFAKKRGIQ